MKGIAAVTTGPEKIEIQEFEIPAVKEDDLLLKVDMVSICGSDPKIYKGKIPSPQRFPVVMGHEMVGIVQDIGEKATVRYGVKIGDCITVEPYIQCSQCIFCRTGNYGMCIDKKCYGVPTAFNSAVQGAYATHMLVLPGSKIHKVNEGIPKEAACLSSVIGNGVRWSRTKGKIGMFDTVVINGAGSQGLSSLLSAKILGAYPIIMTGLSKDKIKLDFAKKLGADYIIDIEKDDLYETVKQITSAEMADVVVEVSGSVSGIQSSLKLLKPMGRFVIVGKTGISETLINTDFIINNEITVIGGLGQSGDVEAAMEIINSKRFPIEQLITHKFPLEDADKALRFFREGHKDCIKVALQC